MSKVGVERRNLEEQWFGIIRPVVPARIPSTDFAPTWPITRGQILTIYPPVDSLTSEESSRSKSTLA